MQAVTSSSIDPVLNILRSESQPLDAIFAPKTVAVIGATEREGSVGRTILWNLISNPFGGTVFPVNPQRSSVLGIKTYPTIASVPEAVDLAVIVTPAHTVPSVVNECVDAGVKGAVIVSAGFKETGSVGIELEKQILKHARRGQMRVIGPNCLGVMRPLNGLNASFASTTAQAGNVGFISQSGALCTAILDWSRRENVGFSAFISIGSMLDVSWGDLIYYLGDDPNTHSIIIYMESIGDARSFLSAAREVSLIKPIIVLKVGRTDEAAKAAASHTGAMTGSDEVLDAAFRRCGVLRVHSIAYLFYLAEILAKQPRPKSPRLTILTNAGGPGVIATDALIAEGGELSELAPTTCEALDRFLPEHWSHNNPIDILGDANPERYAKAIDITVRDPNSDGLLVILTPQAMTDPTQTAEQLKPYAKIANKPIFASWIGGTDVEEGARILNQAGIPTFPYPDTAARLFNYMWRYNYNLQGIYETPALSPVSDENVPDRTLVERIIQTARQAGRTILTEYESKQILTAYGIPTVPTQIATCPLEAIRIAEAIGYPVVLKLFSETITHKTDVGGVQLNLNNAQEVQVAYHKIKHSVNEKVGIEHFLGVTVQPMVKLDGYELIVGSSLDPQFGPVLLFGTGGQLVEVFKDRALALPPLNTTLARRMMEQTHIYQALTGVRGRSPVDLPALEQILVQFSQLVVEQSWIEEIEINPLLISNAGANDRWPMLALDARVVLQPPDMVADYLPKPAVRPYPLHYATPWTTKNNVAVTIRPIRPEDEPLIAKFHQSLSDESVYLRYAHLIKLSHRIAHDRLIRICFIDYDREMALVVENKGAENGDREIIAVGRLSKLHGTNDAEFAMLVSDRYQSQGLGTELLQRLVQVGQDEKLSRITANILPDNLTMQRVCKKLGFHLQRSSLSEPMIAADLLL